MLEVRGLARSFGALRAVDGLDFHAPGGQVTAIIGPNGAGKSTAFNLISGAIAPRAGRVAWEGRDITGWSPRRLRRAGLARSFQITSLFPSLSVFENLELAASALDPWPQQFGRRTGAGRCWQALDRFGLAALAGHAAGELSHGDQRRLEIAVCMVHPPRLLLLDEPTQGMSPSETAATGALIAGLAGEVTVVLVEHDVHLVMQLAQHLVVMHQGRCIFEGTPQAARRDAAVRAAYLGDDDEPPARAA